MSLSKGDIVELIGTFNTLEKFVEPEQITDDVVSEFNKAYSAIVSGSGGTFNPYDESEDGEEYTKFLDLCDNVIKKLSGNVNETDASGSYIPVSDFLKQLDTMGGPVNEDDKMEFDGKTFTVKSFETEDETNDFLATEEGSKWGVLAEKDGKIYVAQLTDLGEAKIIKKIRESVRNIQPGHGGYVIHDDGTLVKGYSIGGSPNWYYNAWVPIDTIGADNPYSTITSVDDKWYGRIGTNKTTTDRTADHKKAYDYIRQAFPTLVGGTEQDGEIVSTQGVKESKEMRLTKPMKLSECMQLVTQLAASNGIDLTKYDEEEVKRGLDVEAEHGSNNEMYNVTGDDLLTTLKIALVHLDENPKYYTLLAGSGIEGEHEETPAATNEDKDPALMPYRYKGTQQQLEADLKMLYGDITTVTNGDKISYMDKDGDQPLGEFNLNGKNIIWVYPSSVAQWNGIQEAINFDAIKKNLTPFLKNKTVDASGSVSGIDDYIDSSDDLVTITIPYAAMASMDDGGKVIDMMNAYSYTKNVVIDGDKQAIVITMFNENYVPDTSVSINTTGYYLYNGNSVRGGYKAKPFATKEMAQESLKKVSGKYTNVVSGPVLKEILEARGIKDLKTTDESLDKTKHGGLIVDITELRIDNVYLLDGKIPVMYEGADMTGGFGFIITEGEDVGMPVTVDSGEVLKRFYLGQIQEAEGNTVLETGKCECSIAPMGQNGLEGFDEGDQYKYEHMSSDNSGKPYYRLYQDEEYSTCGTGTFAKFFKKVGDPTKPVQESVEHVVLNVRSSMVGRIMASTNFVHEMISTDNSDGTETLTFSDGKEAAKFVTTLAEMNETADVDADREYLGYLNDLYSMGMTFDGVKDEFKHLNLADDVLKSHFDGGTLGTLMKTSDNAKYEEGKKSYFNVDEADSPYYDTMNQAIEAAKKYATDKGYTVVDDNVMWDAVNYETTVKKDLPLLKDGKEQRKMLHISFYRMPSGKYELTQYIN